MKELKKWGFSCMSQTCQTVLPVSDFIQKSMFCRAALRKNKWRAIRTAMGFMQLGTMISNFFVLHYFVWTLLSLCSPKIHSCWFYLSPIRVSLHLTAPRSAQLYEPAALGPHSSNAYITGNSAPLDLPQPFLFSFNTPLIQEGEQLPSCTMRSSGLLKLPAVNCRTETFVSILSPHHLNSNSFLSHMRTSPAAHLAYH